MGENTYVTAAEIDGLFMSNTALREEFYQQVHMLEDRRSRKG